MCQKNDIINIYEYGGLLTLNTICVTGHRPNKLYGYDLSDKRYQKLKEVFKTFLINNDCSEAISGMALGVDTVFALAVIELKSEGYDIKLRCAIPCLNHTSKWFNKSDIDRYNYILSKADFVDIVTKQNYAPYLMQVRNKYMVDKSDIVLSVWNGTAGGTGNCVDYAKTKSKTIYNISPASLNISII